MTQELATSMSTRISRVAPSVFALAPARSARQTAAVARNLA